MVEKFDKHILIWGDSPHAKTGFGRVIREIIRYLPQTWKFTIVGINHPDIFTYISEDQRIKIIPTKITSDNLMGNELTISLYSKENYDLLFVLNDLDVTSPLATRFATIRDSHKATRKKYTPILYYFPVDGPMLGSIDFLKIANTNVTYTQWAKEILRPLLPKTIKIEVIPHGTDVGVFKPINKANRRELRQKLFHVFNDDIFVIVNVNTNSARKDLFQCIQALKAIKETGLPTFMYLHSEAVSYGFNLYNMSQAIGLQYGKDLLFGIPSLLRQEDTIINTIYNAADCFLTTSRREGWGLSSTEAAAAGCSVVAPNYGPFTENFNDGRGYLFEPDSLIWTKDDNRGYGYFSTTKTISNKLIEVRKEQNTKAQEQKILKAREYTQGISWEKLGPQWIEMFTITMDTHATSN